MPNEQPPKGKKAFEVTVGGKALSEDKAARVQEALQKAIKEQLQKEALAPAGTNPGDVSSHGRW
jgi:hypothetical protein